MKVVGNGTNKEGEIVPTLFTWANLITLFRFLLVPYFSWVILAEHHLIKGFWILIILGSTDWLDGWVARSFHQVSSWGQLLDPLADRIGLGIIAITLVVAHIAPWWLIPALIIPDTVIFIFGLIVLKGSPNLVVTYLGKVRTALLFLGIPLLVLSATAEFKGSFVYPLAHILVALGCLGHIGAGLQYFSQSVHTYKLLHEPQGAHIEAEVP